MLLAGWSPSPPIEFLADRFAGRLGSRRRLPGTMLLLAPTSSVNISQCLIIAETLGYHNTRMRHTAYMSIHLSIWTYLNICSPLHCYWDVMNRKTKIELLSIISMHWKYTFAAFYLFNILSNSKPSLTDRFRVDSCKSHWCETSKEFVDINLSLMFHCWW